MELFKANQQWSSRPDDERYTSLTSMADFMANLRRKSRALVLPNRALTAMPVEDDPDHKALVVQGPGGHAVGVSHWAFGQLAQRAGAPASYLRDLPAPLAADCVNYGLATRQVEDVGVLLRADGAPQLAAVTGPEYGRVWNADVVAALVKRFGDGVTGHFRVPGIRGAQLEAVTKENTTLFASDRDMFLFLADEERRIEVPNRRDGEPGSLARGFFVWNSEVGSATFGVATFLFDFVCANRIVWGADEYREIRIRHTSGAPERWMAEVAPALERYARSSDKSVTAALEAARAARIGAGEDDKAAAVADFLNKRFTKSQTAAILTAHQLEEHRPVETLWDAAVAVTAYARGIPHQDKRVEVEREAGAILSLARR